MNTVLNKISIFLLLLVVSCEKVIDFPKDEVGRIYVNAVLGYGLESRINLVVSHPVSGQESSTAVDVTLDVKADGNSVTLARDMDYSSDIQEEISYIVQGDFKPGQVLELNASAPGLPSVKARTIVPPAVPEVEISHKEVKSYKNKEPDQTMGYLTTLLEFRMEVDESHLEDTFWGVQVARKTMYETVGTVPDYKWEEYKEMHGKVEYDDLYVNTRFSEGGALSSQEAELYTVFDGGEMLVLPAETEGEESALYAYVYPEENGRLLAASYNDAGERYEIYEFFEYNIRLYRLSSELYHFIRARYVIENANIPIHLGFSPVTYTYTNVEGGLGVFGSVASYESGWFRTN